MTLDKFKIWLEQNGAEILPITNEFEMLRFRGSEVGIIYKSGKYNSPYAKKAFDCYKNNKPWDGKPINIGRSNSYSKQKKAILKRDGCNCFYCGEPLGDDITLEHLISLSSGGKNTLGNMVLAHEKCNQNAGNKTVLQKVYLAIKMRHQ